MTGERHYTEESFYHKLMNDCVGWRMDDGDQQVMVKHTELIENWEHVAGEHPSQLGVEIPLKAERLVIYRSSSSIYSAFTLGEIKRDRWEDRHLEFQFAFYKSSQDDPLIEGPQFIFNFRQAGGNIRYYDYGRFQLYDTIHRGFDLGVASLEVEDCFKDIGLQVCFDSIQVIRFGFARENLRKIQ